MEAVLSNVIGILAIVAEMCGALVIMMGIIRTIVVYVPGCFRRGPLMATGLRIRLGQSMVMGLEFQVAADILKTASYPTWNDILQLSALIALRTILNYLLERELKALGVEEPCRTCDEIE
jgi:uncharacterized membrane protein